MKKPRILSGIQPSGKLHIGNYLGALSNFAALQDSAQYDCFFMIADYHSLSEDYDPKAKSGQVLNLAASFLAAGLNAEKSTLFVQSQAPEHTELAWIFDCLTPVAQLQRMTQYKDKAGRQVKNINMGLFNYPVLQAADILLYKPDAVPVGHDQKQHLELTNLIAGKFNRRFGRTFSEIRPLWTQFPRVMDLKRPENKMSKSSPEGCLFLDDEPEEIRRKLQKAVTASESGKKSPGEENLMALLAHFGKSHEIADFKKQQSGGALKYSELKTALAAGIAGHFSDFREKKKALLARPKELKQLLADGSSRARKIASQTLNEVKQKIGLL